MKIDKMQADMVTEALEAAKLPTDGTLTEQVERLTAHYNKVSAEHLVKCTECEGVSDGRLDACPFCGDAGEDEDESEAPEAPEDDAPVSEPTPLATETESKGDTKPTKKGKNKPEEKSTVSDKTSTKKSDKKTETPAAEGTAKPTKVEAKEGEIVSPDGAIVQTKPTKEIVIEPLPEGVTVEKLDAALKVVFDLKSRASEGYWDLGHKIKEIHDKQLWKARRDENGKGFVSWKAFTVAELGFSDTQANKMMDCSVNFTREEVGKFGTSKLGLVLEAPLEARQAILKKVEEGAGKRELAGDVKAAKDEARAKGETTGGDKGRERKGGAANDKAGNAASTKKITVAALLGTKVKVKAWATVDKGTPPRRAKNIETDAPFFSYDLGNETKLMVQLALNSENEIDASINFIRAVKKQKDQKGDGGTEKKAEKADKPAKS